MTEDQYAKAVAAIERLATLYPRTFFLLGRNRWPLKIGIFDDLVAAGVAEPGELELAFGLYCRSFGYRRAMRTGATRLGLDGGAAGTVSAEHAVTAKELEKRRATYRARKEAERKAAEEAAHKIYVEAWETIDKLAELYPLAFFVKGRNRRPLKLDIIKDLVGGMPERELENALQFYTRSHWYFYTMRKEGTERINLAGEPLGLVTADEAKDAVAGMKACQLRMDRRRQKREAEAAQLPITETAQPIAETAQPKRLGLSELKAAAMARRQSNMESNMENANA